MKKKKISEEKRIWIKKVLELVVFSFLLSLLIIPGLFYTDVLAHEFFHYVSNKGIAEEICIDINKPYLGHVKVGFNEQKELLEYKWNEMDKEEKRANLFGHIVAGLYLINALVVVNWMLNLVVKRQGDKWG